MNTEATNESNSEAAIDDPKRAERIKDEVRIYFYPKIIFLLPTLIYCVLAACYLELAGTDGSPTSTQAQTVEATTESSENVEVTKEVVESNTPEATVTIIFMFVFTLNLVVMAFDFPSNRFLALIAFVFLAMAGLWILSEKNPELMGGLSDFISSIKPAANAPKAASSPIAVATSSSTHPKCCKISIKERKVYQWRLVRWCNRFLRS